MKISPRLLLALLVSAFCARVQAAVPPPEKLLPKDTLMVFTAPDWTKASSFWSNQPFSKLWQDLGLKPFKDKLVDKFTTAVVKPMEQNLGIKFSDYTGLAQGQLTFALIPITPKDKGDAPIAAVLLMDVKDHASQLKSSLGQITKKWTDAGKPLKSQKIRETDFTTIFVSPKDFAWMKALGSSKATTDAAAEADDKSETNKMELTFGQSDSLLVVSTSPQAIDKVLSRQSGGGVLPLEESTAFAADYGPRLRESPMYFWLSVKSLTDLVSKLAADSGASENSPVSVDSILTATGLNSINSVSLSYKHFPEGDCTQFFVGVPEEKRPVLLKIFAADPKDSSPPAFVPADVVQFWRWRLNIPNSWKSLEAMLNNIVPPQVMAQLNMVFGMAGKDKDEHYDLKAELLNSLGDDIISYSKAAKGNTLADVKAAPSIVLIGSPNPDKLAGAVKVALAMFGAPTEREFLGRKIYSLGAQGAAMAIPGFTGIHYTASGGYLAISGNPGILEEYLRSSDSQGKALKDMPGLSDAAQKIGGMSTGLFGYSNDQLAMRATYEMLRKQDFKLQDLLGAPIPDATIAEKMESVRQWADFSLLPPYDTIAKYFNFSVFGGSFSADGFALKAFVPIPPQMR